MDLSWLPLQSDGDVIAQLVDLLPLVLLILGLAAVFMWVLAAASRYFEYLKIQESKWLDRDTIGFIQRVFQLVWVILVSIAILAIAQTRSQPLRDFLIWLVARVPAIFLVVLVLLGAVITVRILHRFAGFLRGELKVKPRRTAPARALAMTELVLKYAIYSVAVIVAFLGGVRALPAGDQAAFEAVVALPQVEATALVSFVVLLLVAMIVDRLVDSLFEDLKRRTKKFSTRVLDEFKSLLRYAVWVIAVILAIFLALDLILTAERLVVFAVAFVVVFVVAALVSADALRNALAGVTLMLADPFDVGERVKIGPDLVCDIVVMNLTVTQVRTLRGELVNFSNQELLRQPILNFSRSKTHALFVDVNVDFSVPHEQVRGLLLDAATQSEGIVDDPAPQVFAKNVSGGSIAYQLLAYTAAPNRMKEVKNDLLNRIQEAFLAARIKPVASG